MKTWLLIGTLLSLPSFWGLIGWLGGRRQWQPKILQVQRLTFVVSVSMLLVFFGLAVLLSMGMLPPVEEALFKLHPLNAAVLVLVLFIGAVLIRFSRNYLQGEPCYPRFFRWMMLTLTAVVVTLMANHLVVFWCGWLSISLSLHRLLTLYDDRPRAVLAAHKKFILARIAELSVLGAFILLYLHHGSWFIDEILVSVRAQGPSVSDYDAVAGVLLVLAALIKCAQLPVHGWLINVVEAPTPVSALLHAGVINLGGYLLMLFAPLILAVPQAQWLALVVAGLSMMFASLIMITRVSVKVRLAWSTSAQMGLMLIECAMGLVELALLHLIAHSLYKAFAFLRSGNAVYEQLQQQLTGVHRRRWYHWALSVLVALALVCTAVWLTRWQGPISPWLLVAFALTGLLAENQYRWSLASVVKGIGAVALLIATYSLMKGAVNLWVGATGVGYSLSMFSVMDLWVAAVFTCLFALSLALRYGQSSAKVRSFSQILFAGLYLDEWFTRVTLRLWPVSLKSERQTAEVVALPTRENAA